MKRWINSVAFCLLVLAPVAGAYEYPLQFTPNPGYRGLVVAGYRFVNSEVVGNCSYHTVSGGSGRGGGGGGVVKNYHQTCTWDLYGNLLSITPGAPAIPVPLSIHGRQVVFAVNGNGEFTGADAKIPGHGFVNTPGSHFSWLTPNNNGVLQQMDYTHIVTLKSDGDVPVDITAITASALLGTAAIKSTTCIGQIKVGATCSVTVTYDTTKITSSTSLAYDTFRIDVSSNAGASHDFIENFTIVMPQKIE